MDTKDNHVERIRYTPVYKEVVREEFEKLSNRGSLIVLPQEMGEVNVVQIGQVVDDG
jgi:hypothetical protein